MLCVEFNMKRGCNHCESIFTLGEPFLGDPRFHNIYSFMLVCLGTPTGEPPPGFADGGTGAAWRFGWHSPSIKMNLHSVLLNDSFALESFTFICATPLEQFQILPLSAQVYPASASISSLEQCNLFPQVSTDSEFVYMSGAGLAAKLTS